MAITEETQVVIVGAGPAGLASSTCLTKHAIPHTILEKEDCCAPLWKKHAYDRLHLHLAKTYCSLPFKPHSTSSPTFMSRDHFVEYIDDYVAQFDIKPHYCCVVMSASYDDVVKKWRVKVKNALLNNMEVYVSKFLIVATGENGKGFIPEIDGLEDYRGRVLHSSEYKNGSDFQGQNVLIVGCGNSGMEIAYDICNHGASASIVIRSPFHVVSRDLIRLGMFLMKYFPMKFVDPLITYAVDVIYGDLTKYGIHRPNEGIFFLKATKGRSPVIDVGTVGKLKSGEIKVRPAISCIKEQTVVFEDGNEHQFDTIVFATGFKSTACEWLEDYAYVVNRDGFPKNEYPMHWKGEKGLYCAGFSRMGLSGVSSDAEAIADDIDNLLHAA